MFGGQLVLEPLATPAQAASVREEVAAWYARLVQRTEELELAPYRPGVVHDLRVLRVGLESWREWAGRVAVDQVAAAREYGDLRDRLARLMWGCR